MVTPWQVPFNSLPLYQKEWEGGGLWLPPSHQGRLVSSLKLLLHLQLLWGAFCWVVSVLKQANKPGQSSLCIWLIFSLYTVILLFLINYSTLYFQKGAWPVCVSKVLVSNILPHIFHTFTTSPGEGFPMGRVPFQKTFLLSEGYHSIPPQKHASLSYGLFWAKGHWETADLGKAHKPWAQLFLCKGNLHLKRNFHLQKCSWQEEEDSTILLHEKAFKT